jgi:hypothetical protein
MRAAAAAAVEAATDPARGGNDRDRRGSQWGHENRGRSGIGSPAPIPGVELRLVGAGGSVQVRADRRGRFNVDLAPGGYQIRITGHGPTANGLPMQPTPDAILVPHAAGHPLRLVVSIT